jgi:hypothetical protein
MKIEAARRLRASDYRVLAAQLDYEQWSAILSHINEPQKVVALDVWKSVKTGLDQINSLVQHVKKLIEEVAHEVGLEIKDIIETFRTKPMLAFLKACKFSIMTLVKPLKAFATLYKDGILKIFAELHDTKAFQQLHSGAIKVDEFLARYPLLRQLAGPAIAGLLIWIWLTGNFTAHPDLDMDLVALIKAALGGHWSAAELFTSPQGLLMMGLLVAGLTAPWPSPAWLTGSVPFNILVALCYTAYKHAPTNPTVKQGLSHLKSKIKFSHV